MYSFDYSTKDIKLIHIELYVDYSLSDVDLCAHIIIAESSKDDIPVKIDEIFVKQHQLLCLLEQGKWLEDDVSTTND
jgi:hypothetical protein